MLASKSKEKKGKKLGETLDAVEQHEKKGTSEKKERGIKKKREIKREKSCDR